MHASEPTSTEVHPIAAFALVVAAVLYIVVGRHFVKTVLPPPSGPTEVTAVHQPSPLALQHTPR